VRQTRPAWIAAGVLFQRLGWMVAMSIDISGMVRPLRDRWRSSCRHRRASRALCKPLCDRRCQRQCKLDRF
jgi:hypothetical protein